MNEQGCVTIKLYLQNSQRAGFGRQAIGGFGGIEIYC
jgi:hypothetical protein